MNIILGSFFKSDVGFGEIGLLVVLEGSEERKDDV